MKIEQVYSILNTMTTEILGESEIVNEDLSNVVDIGTKILDATDVDAYVKKLINHIGYVKFVDRTYYISTPSILKEGWEYGSILEKVQMDIPESSENPTWGLVDKQSYDQNVFNSPSISTKFFNKAITFQIDMSITDKQVKQSFSNATQLNSFFSMIYNRIETRQMVDLENLTLRTINNMTAATIYSDYQGDDTLDTKSGTKAINLLYLYNSKLPDGETKLTPENCLQDLNFLKFASYQIMLYSDRMEKISTLFNIENKERFTPKQFQHIVLHSEFARSADVYLQSDTFHNEFTKLPKSELVTYWQGSGTDYSFASTSDIHVNILDPITGENTVEMNCSGILGVIFDHEALGVNNEKQYVTTHYNAKGEFTNNYYKMFAQYFNDYQENFIVFFVA